MSAARIATIAPECNFIADLAAGLLADSLAQGVPLADYRVLLPTRRAARSLRAALVPPAGAVLLPRLQTLGETDEDALDFAALPDAEDVPQAITPLRRRLLLAQLLQEKYDATLTAAGAWQLAGSLASLLDDLLVQQLPPSALDAIVPAELAEHWQKIVVFLRAITQDWPQWLAREGLVDPVTRQQALVARQIAAWQAQPPATPVIAAGSTASMPATAQLLHAITQLPRGLVILPGLDRAMPEEEWERLEPSHPQYTMRQWLERCAVPRRQVKVWLSPSDAATAPRAAFLQTALLPAAATSRWMELPNLPQPLPGLALAVAENLAEEALMIALVLRETLTTPERTAMLVTRDRALAARVAEQLRRWDIHIDDSAGQPLAQLPLGALLQLIAAAAAPDATGLDLLALLKHPLVTLGRGAGQCRAEVRQLEMQFWRGHRRRGSAVQQLAALPAGTPQHDLLRDLAAALQPVTVLLQQALVAMPALLAALASAAEQLALTPERSGADNFWRGAAGELLAQSWQEAQAAAAGITLRGVDCAAWLRGWLEEITLRPAHGLHPRLAILGPLEARLLTADRVIIGGLHDASWPGASALDPWLSRPMRATSGLPLPERQQGQAAHDFVQLASRGDVLLTRARKLDGQPTTPSRLLLRLQTVLRAAGRDPAELEQAVQPWLDWARTLDKPGAILPNPAPQPRPAAALRPRNFSVTEIGLWRCNPYGFYAKRILALKPLKPLEPDLTQADFGNLVHRVLEDFGRETRDWPGAPAALDLLQTLGQAALANLADEPVLQAAWQVQFANLAHWLVAAEATRRGDYRPEQCEAPGSLSFKLDGVDYTLHGRADRIDAHSAGWTIIDYKTGRAPKDKEVAAGYAPQLPLLGLLAQQGAFPRLPSRPVHELLYYQVAGRGKDSIAALTNSAGLIAAAEVMLHKMLRAFADTAMPYLVTPVPAYVPRHDDYALLARSAEWGAAGDASEAAA